MTDRVMKHFRLFNEAVRSRDWTAFLATFTPDAVMSFDGVPAGPYAGLDQIARGCAERPPSDTMTCVSDARDGDCDAVRFAWDAGGGGTLRVCWRDGLWPVSGSRSMREHVRYRNAPAAYHGLEDPL